MNLKVILLVSFLLGSCLARSNRVERQSPIMQTGMKVFEDIRGGVQRTFQGLMSRIMGRPDPGPPRIRVRPSLSPQHSIPPLSPHHSVHHSVNHLSPQHSIHHLKSQHSKRMVRPANDHVPPIFKTATSSNFAIIHDNHITTPFPFSSTHFQKFEGENFNIQSFGKPKLSQGKRQIVHPNNHFHEQQHEERISSMIGSSLIQQLPRTSNGWVAIPPPYLQTSAPKNVIPLSHSKPNSVKHKIHLNKTKPLHQRFENKENKNRHVLSSGLKFKSIHEPNNGPSTRPRSKRPFQSPDQSFNSNFNGPKEFPPIYSDDIKRPLHNKNSIRIGTPSLQPKSGLNLARNRVKNAPHNSHQQPHKQKGGKLFSNGLRMEMSKNKDKVSSVDSYEFGYGVNDKHSGNQYYHAEKREGGKTEGSYKVQLPDGRVQTVDYMADDHGYHPKISFEGEAKFPDSRPKQISKHSPKNVRQNL